VEILRSMAGVMRKPVGLDTILATVLFTDIVESTARQAELGDRAWKDLVQAHHGVVREELARWRGIENDTAGDGFYATFDGPARAIRCALEIIERVRDLGIEVRAGIHTGECELVDGKATGIAVTIGARVASTAGPSDVHVTQTVKDLVAGSGFTFKDVGEHELKGVPDRWRLFEASG
jgi:class 3 adenylate cyclase